ncbi:MAG: FAD-dependent monooxygenase [Pseudomonadota bacterium]|nr:FAD-dependent monooxygenase [Pseudomonadota bacterium]
MKEFNNTDILIFGGGILGCYLGLKLQESGYKTLIVEKNSGEIHESPRTVTLNNFSKNLLIDFDSTIFNLVEKHSVQQMKVFDFEGTGKILFDCIDANLKQLNYVVSHADLLSLLRKKANDLILFENSIQKLNEKNDAIEVQLSSDELIRARLIISCESNNLKLLEFSDLNLRKREYEQTALVGLVESSCPQADQTAHQIFSDFGILALMPFRKSQNRNKFICSMVWSIPNNLIKDFATGEEFVDKFLPAMEEKLSFDIKLLSKSGLQSYSLYAHHAQNYFNHSTLLIGDAAHAIHPLAGQGINLGFADIDSLLYQLINKDDFIDASKLKILMKNFSRERHLQNEIMLQSMNAFVSIFESKNLYTKFLRNFGLKQVNKKKFLKNFFVEQASGPNEFLNKLFR